MKTRKDLIKFLENYNMTNCNRNFSRADVEAMSNDDLECWIAIMTMQFTDDLKHSLENASIKMENGREQVINDFFCADKEKNMGI